MEGHREKIVESKQGMFRFFVSGGGGGGREGRALGKGGEGEKKWWREGGGVFGFGGGGGGGWIGWQGFENRALGDLRYILPRAGRWVSF